MTEGEAVADDVKLEYHEDHHHEINKDDGVEERVCSLCGDIGFEKSLLLCKKCGFRFQHSYCSRLYPDIDMDKWSCEWCLHQQQQQHHHKQMDAAAAVVDDYEFRRNHKRNKKRKRQRSNSKVFEFLLDIADDQSSPRPEAEKYSKGDANQQLEKTSTVRGRDDDEYRRSISIISSSVSEEKVMKRSSSSSSSSSFGYNKRKLVDIGLESPTGTAATTIMITTTSTSTTSTREKSSVAAAATAAEMQKKGVHQEMGNGRFQKTAVTKNKSNNNNKKAALDRWRNLAANKNKLGCRRYKLLADVHC